MRLKSLIFDDFFTNPDEVRRRALSKEFREVISPYDGFKFVDIAPEVPEDISLELHTKISSLMGCPILPRETFFRFQRKPYNYCHTDEGIAPYAAIVYLSKEYPPDSGTALMKHMDGYEQEPVRNFFKDHNDPSEWETNVFCQFKFNRLMIFQASDFHRALPANGFGSSKHDSRLILISWFSLSSSSLVSL